MTLLQKLSFYLIFLILPFAKKCHGSLSVCYHHLLVFSNLIPIFKFCCWSVLNTDPCFNTVTIVWTSNIRQIIWSPGTSIIACVCITQAWVRVQYCLYVFVYCLFSFSWIGFGFSCLSKSFFLSRKTRFQRIVKFCPCSSSLEQALFFSENVTSAAQS